MAVRWLSTGMALRGLRARCCRRGENPTASLFARVPNTHLKVGRRFCACLEQTASEQSPGIAPYDDGAIREFHRPLQNADRPSIGFLRKFRNASASPEA